MQLTDFGATLGFAFSVTGPIFMIVFLGAWFKQLKLINDNFIHVASRLVFTVTLPLLLFISIVKTDLQQVLNLELLWLGVAGTLMCFMVLSLVAPWVVNNPRDRGVFVQGSFRSNLGIIGLAFCVNSYGEAGLAAASVFMAALTLLYNVLSVYTLNQSLHDDRGNNLVSVLVGVVKNPLILGILAALLVSYAGLPVPGVLLETGEYFARLTLPLALLCIGGTLSAQGLRQSSGVAAWAIAAKLVLTPLLLVLTAYALGVRGMDLGILFLMVASPTAAASYVMVQAMRGNTVLAANIVVGSTLLSLLTVSLGLALLKSAGWV